MTLFYDMQKEKNPMKLCYISKSTVNNSIGGIDVLPTYAPVSLLALWSMIAKLPVKPMTTHHKIHAQDTYFSVYCACLTGPVNLPFEIDNFYLILFVRLVS